MTIKRNISEDQTMTKMVIDNWLSGNKQKREINWLGHTKGTGNLDYMLIEGATINELEQFRGAVNRHLNHLKKEHGINISIIKESGKYIFDDALFYKSIPAKEIFPDDAPDEFSEG